MSGLKTNVVSVNVIKFRTAFCHLRGIFFISNFNAFSNRNSLSSVIDKGALPRPSASTTVVPDQLPSLFADLRKCAFLVAPGVRRSVETVGLEAKPFWCRFLCRCRWGCVRSLEGSLPQCLLPFCCGFEPCSAEPPPRVVRLSFCQRSMSDVLEWALTCRSCDDFAGRFSIAR